MTYDDAIGPMGQAFLATQRAQEASGLSAAELAALDLDEYSRLVHGQTPAQAALSAFYAQEEPEKPSNPAAISRSSAPAGDSSTSNSVASEAVSGPSAGITDEQFLAWRTQRGNQGEGQGIFSSVSSQSRAYRDAAARQAGRNAMITSNIQEPRKVGRVYLADEIPPSGRRQFYAGS